MSMTQSIINFRNRYSQDNPQAMRNPWVLGWILIVIIFITVNITFFITAMITSPGLVVEDYYEQGRQYEKNALKLMIASTKLQWEMKMEVPETITVGLESVYRFSATDKLGLPINAESIQLVAYRPSNSNADMVTALHEIAPGLYQAALKIPLPGVWELQVKLKTLDDELQISRRITAVKP